MPYDKCRKSTWKVETNICGPEAAVDKWRKDNPKPDPGIQVTPVQADIEAQQSAAAATAPEWIKQKLAAQQ